MVTIKDQGLSSGIKKTLKKAKSHNKPILYSEVQAIGNIDPLSFFHQGKEAYEGTRSYWRNAEGNYFIVGIGISYSLQSSYADNRFFHIEKEWKELLKLMMVH